MIIPIYPNSLEGGGGKYYPSYLYPNVSATAL